MLNGTGKPKSMTTPSANNIDAVQNTTTILGTKYILKNATTSMLNGTGKPKSTIAALANSTSTVHNATTVSGTGDAFMWSCYSDWVTYGASSSSWYTSVGGPYITTATFPSTIVELSTYKLCDGVPRAYYIGTNTLTVSVESYNLGTEATSTTVSITIPASNIVLASSVVNITTVETALSTYDQGNKTYPGPTPTCYINPSQCAELMSTWSHDIWESGYNTLAMSSPICEDGVTSIPSYPCQILIPNVKVLYFPVTTVDGDLCKGNGSTITPAMIGTAPVIVEALGTTFTSTGDVYLAYPGISASANLPSTAPGYWTTSLPAGFLAIPSADLSSFRGHVPGLAVGNIFSFNFADLLPNHVPIDAYEGMETCATHAWDTICQTVFENLYAPNLVYPTQFRTLDTRFSSCGFDIEGLYDPPSALHSVTALVPETTTASSLGQITQSATPANSPAVNPSPTITPANVDSSQGATSTTPSTTNDPAATTITFGDASTQANSDPPATTAENDPTTPENDNTTTVLTSGDPVVTDSSTAAGDKDSPQGASNGGQQTTSNGEPATNGQASVDNRSTSAATIIAVTQSGTSGQVSVDKPSTNAATVIAVTQSGTDGQFAQSNGAAGTQAIGDTQSTESSPQPSAVLTLSNSVVVTVVQVSVSEGNGNRNGASVVADQTTTPGDPAAVVVGSQTPSQGGPAAVVSGETISLGSSGVIIQQNGGSVATISISSLSGSSQGSSVSGAKFATVNLGSSIGLITATAIPAQGSTPPEIVIGSITLTVGGQATTSAVMVFSAASNGLVVEPTSATSGTGAILIVGSSAITAFESLPSGSGAGIIVLGNVTLTIGGAAKTLSNGLVVSGGSAGLIAVSTSNGTVVTTTLSYSSISGSRNSTGSSKSQGVSSTASTRMSSTIQSTLSWSSVNSPVGTALATTKKKSGADIVGKREIDWKFRVCLIIGTVLMVFFV